MVSEFLRRRVRIGANLAVENDLSEGDGDTAVREPLVRIHMPASPTRSIECSGGKEEEEGGEDGLMRLLDLIGHSSNVVYIT